MKITTRLFALLFFTYSHAYGQMEQYNYQVELKGISQQWHEIMLPDGVFGKTSQSLNDIRIFGITESKDTLEAPYILKVDAGETSHKEIVFKTLNTSRNEKGYYFTFEVPSAESINQINLDFKQKNFDWQISLEGSQDQSEWFTVLENYRVLSIKNDLTDFQFTKLAFPSSKYRFFRLFIESKGKPELTKASIAQHEFSEGLFQDYAINSINTKENKKDKQTEIDIAMDIPVRASQIELFVSDSYDYYRPFTIKYLADSVKTEQGWSYNYRTLTDGTLTSMENNTFKFNSTTFQKLKIIIHNQDNQALHIDKIEVKGYVHKLVTRFTEPATYFLAYGNKNARSTNYDIERFTDKIPSKLTALETGKEQIIDKEKKSETEPLFQNQRWLWFTMTFMILLLGWFSLKMIKKKQA